MTHPTALDEEVIFDGRSLISETDTRGTILYVNRKFVEMSGYTREESVGQTHNLLRHPDMPKQIFEQLWKTIKSGNIWEGYVKNLRKDGKFYWVIVNIVPYFDENGKITRFIASRKVAKREDIASISQTYSEICEDERIASA